MSAHGVNLKLVFVGEMPNYDYNWRYIPKYNQ